MGSVDTRLRVEMMQARGENWLVLAARVCSERDVNAVGALLYNATLPIGLLAIDQGDLWLRAVALLHGTTAQALQDTIQYLLTEVAHLVDHRGGNDAVVALFDNLAD